MLSCFIALVSFCANTPAWSAELARQQGDNGQDAGSRVRHSKPATQASSASSAGPPPGGAASQAGSQAGNVPSSAGSPGVPGPPVISPKEGRSVPGVPGSQPVHPPGRHLTAEMKLSGSMCVACLHELETRVKALPGVLKVKIEPPDENYYNYYQAPVLNSWARTVIDFDESVITLEEIKALLRRQGYHPFKIVQKEKQ